MRWFRAALENRDAFVGLGWARRREQKVQVLCEKNFSYEERTEEAGPGCQNRFSAIYCNVSLLL